MVALPAALVRIEQSEVCLNYFISINGAQRGPFSPEQLPGQGLRPETLVWAEGMPQWERADRVSELGPIVAALAPGAQPAYVAPGPGYAAPGQPPYGPSMNYAGSYPAGKPGDKKLAAGLCGIFLGAFGVHKFILGYTTSGVIMLVASLTCVGYPIMHVIGLIEGIMYLAKSDAEFYQEYVVNQKEWF
jgi:TM2 domain-containing membrane protein YozV